MKNSAYSKSKMKGIEEVERVHDLSDLRDGHKAGCVCFSKNWFRGG